MASVTTSSDARTREALRGTSAAGTTRDTFCVRRFTLTTSFVVRRRTASSAPLARLAPGGTTSALSTGRFGASCPAICCPAMSLRCTHDVTVRLTGSTLVMLPSFHTAVSAALCEVKAILTISLNSPTQGGAFSVPIGFGMSPDASKNLRFLPSCAASVPDSVFLTSSAARP